MKTKWIVAEVLLAIVVLLVWYFAVYSRTYPQVEMLRWLDDANAETVFQDDEASGRRRFYVVLGLTADISGIPRDSYERCYKDVTLQSIEGTTDGFVNEEHMRLNLLAVDFARSYNLLMREHIDRQKGESCEFE